MAPETKRRIEWVGETSPLDEPIVQHRMLAGEFTPLQVKALRLAAAHANTRGARVRRMAAAGEPYGTPGLSRTYEWGPPEVGLGYVREVGAGDVDAILGSPAAHEFRDLDAAEPDEPAIVLPPANIRVYAEEVMTTSGEVRRL